MNSFVISSGHAKYVSGASSIINEVTEARKVADKVSDYLKELKCTVYTFHDNTSRTQSQNINTIVSFHNGKSRDFDVSIHFNASSRTDEARGVEVLYYSDGNQSIASKVSKAIADASGLKNRGAKKRTNLGFLKNTSKPAILIEVCFVDSSADVNLYRAKFNEICKAIAESLSGKKLTQPKPTPTSVASSQESEGGKKLNLKIWQLEEMSDIYKEAKKLGIFSDETHAEKVKNGDMTRDEAIYLLHAIVGRHILKIKK